MTVLQRLNPCSLRVSDRRYLAQRGEGWRLAVAGALAPLVVGLWLMTGAGSAFAQQLYRWVDDEGKVHYSDRLPPEATEKARTELSDQGLRVREVDPAKSREELLRDQEIDRLRKEQQAQIDAQRNADQVLLRTYRSIDDLNMMRNGKIDAIDVMIQQIKGNIRRLQNRINRLQADAADLERAGKPVPPQLGRDIDATKESIQGDLGLILTHERTKQGIYEKFAEDSERFRRLKDVREPVAVDDKQRVMLGIKNIVVCDNQRDCDLLWGQAVGYVEAHATGPVESLSDNVAITVAPESPEDIGLIVSRIPSDPKNPDAGATLFLDLQCLSYLQTALSCRTPERVEVLEGFRGALLGDDAAAQQTGATEPGE